MKRIILLAGLFAFCQITHAQCDKAITFKCNKARDFVNYTVGQELPVDATISIDNGKVILTGTMNGETETVEGEIKAISVCNWKEYLKNGVTQYIALTRKEDGNPENSLIEIESVNGYTKITFGTNPDNGARLQFDVTEYTIAGDIQANKPSEKPVQKRKKQRKKSKAIIE